MVRCVKFDTLLGLGTCLQVVVLTIHAVGNGPHRPFGVEVVGRVGDEFVAVFNSGLFFFVEFQQASFGGGLPHIHEMGVRCVWNKGTIKKRLRRQRGTLRPSQEAL